MMVKFLAKTDVGIAMGLALGLCDGADLVGVCVLCVCVCVCVCVRG